MLTPVHLDPGHGYVAVHVFVLHSVSALTIGEEAGYCGTLGLVLSFPISSLIIGYGSLGKESDHCQGTKIAVEGASEWIWRQYSACQNGVSTLQV